MDFLHKAYAQGTFFLTTTKTIHAGKLIVGFVQFVLTAPFTLQTFTIDNTSGLETKLA
jgi:hypothetical protein